MFLTDMGKEAHGQIFSQQNLLFYNFGFRVILRTGAHGQKAGDHAQHDKQGANSLKLLHIDLHPPFTYEADICHPFSKMRSQGNSIVFNTVYPFTKGRSLASLAPVPAEFCK